MVAYEILVSAQGPWVLGFGVWGLRVWGLGLTIFSINGQYQASTWTGDCDLDDAGDKLRPVSPGGGGEGLEITYGENLWAWLRRLEKSAAGEGAGAGD